VDVPEQGILVFAPAESNGRRLCSQCDRLLPLSEFPIRGRRCLECRRPSALCGQPAVLPGQGAGTSGPSRGWDPRMDHRLRAASPVRRLWGNRRQGPWIRPPRPHTKASRCGRAGARRVQPRSSSTRGRRMWRPLCPLPSRPDTHSARLVGASLNW